MKKLFLSLTLLLSAFAGAQAQDESYFVPYQKTALRAPSVPLVVNDPYFSFWSPFNKLTDGTTRHWDNQQKAMDGLLRVDGQVYRFMGTARSVALEGIAPLGTAGAYTAKVKYQLSTAQQDNWMNLDASESGWQTQKGPWGTKSEYSQVQTSWTNSNADIYVRRHVTLTEEQLKEDLYVMYSHDDKCEVYLNGVLVAQVTAEQWSQNVRTKLNAAAKAALVAGDNVLAIHVHNTKGGALADVGLYRNRLGYHAGLVALAPMADQGPWMAKTRTSSAANWMKEDFDDSAWKDEAGAFGAGSEYPNVNTAWVGDGRDIYIRRHITLEADDLQRALCLVYSHDDVCEIYLNGRKVVSTGNTWSQNVTYELTDEDRAVLHEGDNVIAYHVHNTTGGSLADIGLYYNSTGEKLATQNLCSVLANNTYYTFTCGPVKLDVVFTAPFLMDDLDKLSTPINYISYQVRSLDEQEHDVQFFFGTTPELTVNNNGQATRSELVEQNGVRYIKSGSVEQKLLGRAGDHITIDWGYLYLPAINGQVSIADQQDVALTFAQSGQLPAYTAPITSTDEASMPTLAFVRDLGRVATASSYLMIGYDEVKDIRYMDVDYKGYWARNGKTIFQAFNEMYTDYDDVMQRCRQWDQTIYDDALAAANVKYAEVISLSFRHCIAAHKLFEDNKGNLLFFSKENDSNGCVNTVDLTYPSAPLFLIYNTDLLKGMCTSILDYCEGPRWGFDFAAHDLGTYPHANGQVYSITRPDANGGFAGNMPIEESGNIVILAAAISLVDGNLDWAERYWTTLKKWTDYLCENGLDPENQLCTDDFAGHLAHNANLSLKAIMGVAGFGLMNQLKGDEEAANTYLAKAHEMADAWVTLAKDGTHYKLAFDRQGTWSQKYNMVWDNVFGTNLFSETLKKQEFNYYRSQLKAYGLPLDSREGYTKSDWEMWTACLAPNMTNFTNVTDRIWQYANVTTSRVPLSDWYRTGDATMVGFRARSVVGGHWMKVLYEKVKAGELMTPISPIRPDEQPLDLHTGTWYDLSGRPATTNERGIRISQGKKVLVK